MERKKRGGTARSTGLQEEHPVRTDWTYYGCDEHDVPAIEQYWESVRLELDAKAAQLSDAPNQLRFVVERGDTSPVWEIQAALHLPGHTLVATARAQQAEAAIDELLRALARKIDRLQDGDRQARRRPPDASDMVPLLANWHEEGRSDAFLSFMVPLVGAVRPYVEQELRVREMDGALAGELISARDVLDEVLIQSWEQFAKRSDETPLNLWLVRLADAALERLCTQLADVSLDDETAPEGETAPRQEGVTRLEEEDTWIEHVSYPEVLELSELIPDAPGAATWDALDLESKQTRLSAMLGRLDRDQRQAFVLHAVHGYSAAEISDFQDRDRESVDRDIAESFSVLRRYVTDEETPDREDEFVRQELRQRRPRSRR